MDKDIRDLVAKELTQAKLNVVLQQVTLESLNEMSLKGELAQVIAQQQKTVEAQMALNIIYADKLEKKLAEMDSSAV